MRKTIFEFFEEKNFWKFVKKKILINYFLDTNTYMFFSFFSKKMNKFSRNLLSFSFSIACFVCVWVFGNTDYFPGEEDIEKGPKIVGLEKDMYTFEVISGEIGDLKIKPGYTNTLLRRMNSTTLGKTVVLVMLIYGGIILIKYVLYKVKKKFFFINFFFTNFSLTKFFSWIKILKEKKLNKG